MDAMGEAAAMSAATDVQNSAAAHKLFPQGSAAALALMSTSL